MPAYDPFAGDQILADVDIPMTLLPEWLVQELFSAGSVQSMPYIDVRLTEVVLSGDGVTIESDFDSPMRFKAKLIARDITITKTGETP